MCPPADAARRCVLVVEDEPTLRASVVRGLSRALEAEVRGAGSLLEARREIAAHPPAVLVSDIDLPDGTGLELVTELDARGLRIPIVFVSSYVAHYASRVPHRLGIETHEKPIPLERLRRVVEDALARAGDPDASPFAAADYLQLAGMGRKSVVIEVRTKVNVGAIFVRAGGIVAARDLRGEGMLAFRRLAFAEGEVSCRALRRDESPTVNLEGSCEELLMEAARLNDEEAVTTSGEYAATARFSARPLPAHSTPPRAVDRADRESFEDAYAAGVDALLARRYDEAFASFSRAQEERPDDPRVRANLDRLAMLLAGKAAGAER